MNEQSKYIPNSFQTPNAQVDDLMHLLSGDEYKLLSFATRHILGWQDTIVNRRAKISLSMFQNGFKTRNGTWYGGCGLSRGAIINNLSELVTYNLLIPIGEPTNKGQEYELSANPDVAGLQQRYEDQKNANKKRTSKARKKLQEQGGQSDNTGKSDNTTSGQSDNTATDNVALTSGGQSDNTQLNPSLNPQTQEQSAPSTTPSRDWSRIDWLRGMEITEYFPFASQLKYVDGAFVDPATYGADMHAVFCAWLRALGDKRPATDINTLLRQSLKQCKQLVLHRITPYEVYSYVTEQYKDAFWNNKVVSIDNVAKNIQAWKAQPAQANDNGAVEYRPDENLTPTPQEIGEW